MRRLILAATLAAGCSRAPESGTGAVVYAPADRGFACEAPASWRVQEADGGAHRASFFGPPGGPSPFSDAIVVYRHGPKSGLPTMEAFVAAKSIEGPPPIPSATTVNGRAAKEFTYSSTVRGPHLPEGLLAMSHRVVLIADGDGYWALVHSWPAKAKPQSAVFTALVESFRPAAR